MSQYRRLKYNKFGLAENPRWLHVILPNGALREVYDYYYREMPAAFILKVRSLNGEILEEVEAGCVKVLDRTWESK